MDNKKFTNFALSFYGDTGNFSETMSLKRCRIFYKGANRNGTYITDEFAEQLISSLPYTPVKGIYDSIDQDFTDHGSQRYQGRIYGVVPVDNHFAWEKHLDADGVEREYACTDVLLYTAIYKQEALDVVDHAQSMEIYAESIDGDWKYIGGKRYFVFTKGCFLGLQALGKDFEPCFEGAEFYSLVAKTLVESMQQFELGSKLNIGGEEQMLFKLSDDQKYNMIWNLLNPRCNQEEGYIVDYTLCDVYDQYAIAWNIGSKIYERIFYSKDDSTDSLEITGREQCYIVDVNEVEKTALSMLHQLNNNTYEKVDENYSNLQNEVNALEEEKNQLAEANENFGLKIEECENTISTLNQEKSELEQTLETVNGNYSAAQETIQTLTDENQELLAYKNEKIGEEKMEIIDRYSTLLDAEVIASFKDKIEDMTKEELDKELAYALVNSQPTLFTKAQDPGYVPIDNPAVSGIESILSKYKKN